MTGDGGALTQWLGRIEQVADVITPGPAARLAATLDRQTGPWEAGMALPELWHWLYFLPPTSQHDLGDDGHARRGGFLPPVVLPRRMWAGGRIEFLEPLLVGQPAVRTSRITEITEKAGRSGALVFVSVRHDIAGATQPAVVEEQSIVFREAPRPESPAAPPQQAPTDEDFVRTIEPTPALLFRYSALTYNAHRIHYDRDYCRREAGYPGLVVHGPLIATLLVELLQCQVPEARLRVFEFRALRPVFDVAPFDICGRFDTGTCRADLWARDCDGWLAVAATAELA